MNLALTPVQLDALREQHRVDHADDAPMADGKHVRDRGDCTDWGCSCFCGERADRCHVRRLLEAYHAERERADRLAGALSKAAALLLTTETVNDLADMRAEGRV